MNMTEVLIAHYGTAMMASAGIRPAHWRVSACGASNRLTVFHRACRLYNKPAVAHVISNGVHYM